MAYLSAYIKSCRWAPYYPARGSLSNIFSWAKLSQAEPSDPWQTESRRLQTACSSDCCINIQRLALEPQKDRTWSKFDLTAWTHCMNIYIYIIYINYIYIYIYFNYIYILYTLFDVVVWSPRESECLHNRAKAKPIETCCSPKNINVIKEHEWSVSVCVCYALLSRTPLSHISFHNTKNQRI